MSPRAIPGGVLADILDILKACRRSRVKVRVYRGLVELKVALPAELAAYAHTSEDRVLGVLLGDGKKFRRDTSLLILGVARPEARGGQDAWAITRRGEAAWEPVMARLVKTRGPPEG